MTKILWLACTLILVLQSGVSVVLSLWLWLWPVLSLVFWWLMKKSENPMDDRVDGVEGVGEATTTAIAWLYLSVGMMICKACEKHRIILELFTLAVQSTVVSGQVEDPNGPNTKPKTTGADTWYTIGGIIFIIVCFFAAIFGWLLWKRISSRPGRRVHPVDIELQG